MEIWLLYLLAGALAGLLAGLLGIGGGLIVVPALAVLFVWQGIAPELAMHLAVGSSLAVIALTATSSIFAHHRRGAVRWGIFWRLAPGMVAGGFAATLVAHLLPGSALRFAFGCFTLLMAIQIGLGIYPLRPAAVPRAPVLAAGGLLTGLISVLVGVGGGLLTVPFLLWCGLLTRQAVATSAACTLPVSLAGALGFTMAGSAAAGLPEWSTGYVYWPAVLGVAVLSMLAAPVGAHFAHRLPQRTLRRLFALLLAGVGGGMLLF